jgi:hypothetical protein
MIGERGNNFFKLVKKSSKHPLVIPCPHTHAGYVQKRVKADMLAMYSLIREKLFNTRVNRFD